MTCFKSRSVHGLAVSLIHENDINTGKRSHISKKINTFYYIIASGTLTLQYSYTHLLHHASPPLTLAVREGHNAIVEMLLATANISPNVKT